MEQPAPAGAAVGSDRIMRPRWRVGIAVVPDAAWVRRLDRLARPDVHEGPGAELCVVSRDGTVRTGDTARWLPWARLPLVSPLLAAAHALRRVVR